MKKFADMLSQVETESVNPIEGDNLNIVINEELSITTDIVATSDNEIYIAVDKHTFKLLNKAGLLRKD